MNGVLWLAELRTIYSVLIVSTTASRRFRIVSEEDLDKVLND